MKRRTFLAALAAMALTVQLAGCAAGTTPPASSVVPQTSAPENSHYPVTITNYNYAGEPVTYTYTQAPQRVVAVYQGSIESMIALGLEDHVAASYGLDNEVKAEWQEGFAQMNYQADVFAPDK